MLLFLRHKCRYVAIFATTIVFQGFLLQTSVASRFLVSKVVQFIRAYHQKTGHNGVLAFGKKKGLYENRFVNFSQILFDFITMAQNLRTS